MTKCAPCSLTSCTIVGFNDATFVTTCYTSQGGRVTSNQQLFVFYSEDQSSVSFGWTKPILHTCFHSMGINSGYGKDTLLSDSPGRTSKAFNLYQYLYNTYLSIGLNFICKFYFDL